MKEELIDYKGKSVKVISFETELHLNQPVAKILADIEKLLDEEADTKSGKRKIKRLSK